MRWLPRRRGREREERPLRPALSLSVVIATCDRAKALEESLLRFRRQTDPGFEVVVASDGSRDGTLEMLAGLAPELPFPLRWVETGERDRYCLGKARNLGILASRGEAVLILDDDSFPEPELVAEHKRTVEWKTLTGGYRNSHDPADELHAKMARHERGAVSLREAVENNCCMYRRDWIGCGLFSERIEGYGGVGIEFTARLAYQGYRYAFNPRAMIYHHRELEGRGGPDRAAKREQHERNLADLRTRFWPGPER